MPRLAKDLVEKREQWVLNYFKEHPGTALETVNLNLSLDSNVGKGMRMAMPRLIELHDSIAVNKAEEETRKVAEFIQDTRGGVPTSGKLISAVPIIPPKEAEQNFRENVASEPETDIDVLEAAIDFHKATEKAQFEVADSPPPYPPEFLKIAHKTLGEIRKALAEIESFGMCPRNIHALPKMFYQSLGFSNEDTFNKSLLGG